MGLFDRLQEDLDQRERMAAMTPADLLELESRERAVVQLLMRRGDLAIDDVAAALQMDGAELAGVLATLEEKGFVRRLDVRGSVVLRTYFARKGASRMPGSVWDLLAKEVDDQARARGGSTEASDDAGAVGGPEERRPRGGEDPGT